jgi:alpha-glucosidase
MKTVYQSLPIILITLVLTACQKDHPMQWKTTSPDGQLSINVLKTEDGTLTYNVTRTINGIPDTVIRLSPLGLDITGYNLSGLQPEGKTAVKSIKSQLTRIHGKQNPMRDEYQEQTIQFRNADGNRLSLILRAYNDGVAFRYNIESGKQDSYLVNQELTGFAVPEGKAWLQPYDKITMWTPAYEKPFQSGIPVGTTSPNTEGWCFPALFETNKHWMLITESDLDANYAGSHLQPEAPQGLYRIRFPEPDEAMGLGSAKPTITLPWQSPWRVIITGESVSSIVESDLVDRVARPSTLTDTQWIKPGIASWSWWSDHDSPKKPKELREFTELAKHMNWPYTLIDANWNLLPETELQALLQHARENHVAVWLWYNSGGPHNEVTEQPRDRMHIRETRRKEFEQLERWGVVGIKVDFWQSDKQDIIRQYIELLEDAADYHIMVNVHGCTIPRGWSKTFPHLMSMESVWGSESYSFAANYPEEIPAQNVIYAFTRNVIGPMDYTPVTFSNQTFPHLTTNGHELALSVVFESGVQHFADRVSAYLSLPEPVKQFLMDVPTAWDETRLLSGYPGQDLVLARRKDTRWYIGGINGENREKEMTLDLATFGSDEWRFIQDSSAGAFSVQDRQITSAITITLKAYGGFVAVSK